MQESTVHHLRLVTIKRQNQLTYLSHFVVNDTRTNYRRNKKQQLDTIQLWAQARVFVGSRITIFYINNNHPGQLLGL